MVSASKFGSQDPRFKSHWRENSFHDLLYFIAQSLFIIILLKSQYDLNNVKRDIKHQIVIIIIYVFICYAV